MWGGLESFTRSSPSEQPRKTERGQEGSLWGHAVGSWALPPTTGWGGAARPSRPPLPSVAEGEGQGRRDEVVRPPPHPHGLG